jgi:hypothetical protein
MIFLVITMAAGRASATFRFRLPSRFQARFSPSLTWSRLAMLPSVTTSFGSPSTTYRSRRWTPLPTSTSSTSLIDVELMSTPINAGDFTVKMSRAELRFSAIMAVSA